MSSPDLRKPIAVPPGVDGQNLPESAGAAVITTPGPTGMISFPTVGDPLLFLGDVINRYGDVVRYQTCFGPVFLFVNPEHIQTILHREHFRRASLLKMVLGDGLLASDGPRWREQRRLMQPDFFPAAVAPFAALMSKETANTATEWRSAAGERRIVNLSLTMTRLTLRVIVKALFSDELSVEQSARLCSSVTQTIKHVGNISWGIFGAPVTFKADGNAAFTAAQNYINELCSDLATRRRALAPADRPRDLLTLLIQANGDGGPMDDTQIRDEIVTMLVGGHETTAIALGWAWKALAEQPGIEAELHREVDDVLQGRPATLADVPKLNWTRSIFQESLRLYPPVWYMARVAGKTDVVHGHAVPKGATVLVLPWFTHRLREFWPDPERFDPARFVDPEARSSPRYAYFPFGGGRHQCIGMQFAMIEGTILLAQLAQQFRIRPVNGPEVKPDPGVTLRHSTDLLGNIELRKPTSATHFTGAGLV